MPNYSITTTLRPTIFVGDQWLQSITFKNGSTTGIIYFLNRANRADTVSSSLYDFSLTAGQSANFAVVTHGTGIKASVYDVISDTAGGVTLEVVPIYDPMRSH